MGGAEKRRRRRAHVAAKTGGRCWYCGADLARGFTVDHAKPRSRGGRNAIFNLLPACSDCNFAKGARTLEEFRQAFGGGHSFWGERRAA